MKLLATSFQCLLAKLVGKLEIVLALDGMVGTVMSAARARRATSSLVRKKLSTGLFLF